MKFSFLFVAVICIAILVVNADGSGLLFCLMVTNLYIDIEFDHVTCGSTIKLTHRPSGYRLHSHEIPYGSGSRQQSVTGFPSAFFELWRKDY